MRYRRSLNTDKLFMEDGNEWFSVMDEISRKDLDQPQIDEVAKLDLIPAGFVQMVVDMFGEKSGLRCFGLDILVEEGSKDLYIIDLNDLPSYNNITGIDEHMSGLFNKLKGAKADQKEK